MKNTITLLGILTAFILGGYISYQFFGPKEPITNQESTILLEKIQNVFKIVTVEGNFHERYTETNIRPITLYLPFATTFNFPKEASILIKGKVLVGYNMEKAGFKADASTKTIRISNLPKAEVLAIDHEIVFENLAESYFNAFTKEDYTQLAKNAKAELKNKALEDKLVESAAAQGNELIDIIEALVTTAGWTLEVQGELPVELED